MKLTCDLCGGTLQMNTDGKGAVCTNCGLTYPIETLRQKMGLQNATAASDGAAAGEASARWEPVTQESVMRELIIERKFDIAGSAYGAVIFVDGVECATLGAKGTVSIPVSEGGHDVWVIVTYRGKANVTLDKVHFQVGRNNWYGLFRLRRTAWKALWSLELVEGEGNNF